MSRLSLGKAQLDYDSRIPDSVDADQECERCGVQSFSDDGALCIVAIPEEGSEGAEGSETCLEICQGCLNLLHAWACPEQAIAQGLDDPSGGLKDFQLVTTIRVLDGSEEHFLTSIEEGMNFSEGEGILLWSVRKVALKGRAAQ